MAEWDIAMRTVRRLLLAVAALASAFAGLPVRQAAASAPFTLSAVDEAAGYFHAEGECPTGTYDVLYRWRNAPNGTGRTQVRQDAGPFSMNVRLQAKDATKPIQVVLVCLSAGGRRLATLGPVSVVSGRELLAAPPEETASGRRMVFSLSAQELWVYDEEDHLLLNTMGSGRRMALYLEKSPYGTFTVMYKHLKACPGLICKNFIGFHQAYAGVVGFHNIPIKRGRRTHTSAELGQPRSAGCIHLSDAAILWLWNWSRIGDTVVMIA